MVNQASEVLIVARSGIIEGLSIADLEFKPAGDLAVTT